MFLSAHKMRVKLLLFTFYVNGGLNGCQIFGRFRFSKSKSEPNFGFPHIPTDNSKLNPDTSVHTQKSLQWCSWYHNKLRTEQNSSVERIYHTRPDLGKNKSVLEP